MTNSEVTSVQVFEIPQRERRVKTNTTLEGERLIHHVETDTSRRGWCVRDTLEQEAEPENRLL